MSHALALASRVTLALGLWALPALAQGFQLNGTLHGEPTGTVISFRLASGGARAVFEADLSAAADSTELYSAPLDASAAPVELGTSLLNGTVREYEVTGPGDEVVLLNRAPNGVQRLYRLPVTGGTPLLLSGASDVDSFELDPSGAHVFYRSRDAVELWSAPVDGSSGPVRLNSTDATGQVEDRAFSPDGAWVVYLQRRDPGFPADLYSAPSDGHAPARRLNLLRPLASVSAFEIAFDSLGVVYVGDQDTDGVAELYAVVIDGNSPPVKRSGPLVSGGDVHSFRLAASSDRILYLADAIRANRVELFSVSAILGGTPVRLNPPLPNSSSAHVADARVSADGTRAVYAADLDAFNAFGLYGVPADGSAPSVRLSDAGQSLDVNTEGILRIVEGTNRALYSAQGALHSAPLDGSQPAVRLYGPFPQGVAPTLHATLADGTVLYSAGPRMRGLEELFRVPLDASTPPVSLTPNLVSWSRVSTQPGHVVPTPDGSRIAYLVRSAGGQTTELFSIPSPGGPAARVAGVLPVGNVEGFPVSQVQLSRAGEFAAYLAAENDSFGPDLHAVATDGSARSLQMNPPMGRACSIAGFAFSPDGERVVYRLQNFGDELHSVLTENPHSDVRLDSGTLSVGEFVCTSDSASVLYKGGSSILTVPIDGSLPPSVLFGVSGSASNLQLSPDGAWIVVQDSTPGLVTFPLDGHQPPVSIHGAVRGFARITSDSTRIVYLEGSFSSPQLYSVPIDGSLPPTRLDNLSSVSTFRLSPDGTRVVFFPGPYSVPVDGSQAPVLLTGASMTGTDDYQIDPSSSRVIFVGHESGASSFELFSVPLDGSAAPVKLSGSLLPGQNVASFSGDPFRISSGGRVLFDVTDVVFRTGLFSVPLDGSALPIRLSTAVPTTIELSTDQSRAYFLRDDELMRVPLDGSAPARSLVPDDVRSILVSPDGEHVLYTAEPITHTVELFSIPLDRTRRRTDPPTFR